MLPCGFFLSVCAFSSLLPQPCFQVLRAFFGVFFINFVDKFHQKPYTDLNQCSPKSKKGNLG